MAADTEARDARPGKLRARAPVVLLTLASSALACSGREPDVPLDPTFANVQSEVFAKSCAVSASCHRGDVATTGRLELDGDAASVHDRLVGMPSIANATETLVVAGAPDSSYLYRKLTGNFDGLACSMRPDPENQAPTACGGAMPYRMPSLPNAKVELVHDWIAKGALND